MRKIATLLAHVNVWDAKSLLFLLAFGQGASLVYAGVILDGTGTDSPTFWLSILRGLGVGIGASFAASYSAYNLNHTQGKIVPVVGWIAWVILLISSSVVVSIATIGAPTGAARAVASVAYAVMTDAAAVAIAAASRRLFSQGEGQKPQAKPEREPAKPKQAQAVPCKNGCGKPVKGINGQNAHNSKCPNNPERMTK